MVDLMMWLVIAALLLAAAIQSIGYYQRAAIIYQMENDVTQAANTTMAAATTTGGFTAEMIGTSISSTKSSSPKTTLIASLTPWSNDEYMIAAKHPNITGHYVVYLFKEHDPYKVGVNLIPQSAMDAIVSGGGSSIDMGAPIFAQKAITLKFNPSFCLSQKSGDPLTKAAPCNGSDEQNWTWSGNGPMAHGASKAQCIAPMADNQLQTVPCSSAANQVFQYRKSLNWNVEIFNPSTGKCLNQQNGYVHNNYNVTVLNLDTCGDQAWQRWGLALNPKIQSIFYSALEPKSCLDLSGASTVVGNNVNMYACNNSTAQKWSWNGQGKIYYGTGDTVCAEYDGTRMKLQTCSNSLAQTFVSRTNDDDTISIFNPAANKCLVYSNAAVPGERVMTLADCTSDITHKWKYSFTGV
jgi:hypothetical protein